MKEKYKLPTLVFKSKTKGYYNKVKDHPYYKKIKKYLKDNS